MYILGNIFGGLSSIFLGASVHRRNKKYGFISNIRLYMCYY